MKMAGFVIVILLSLWNCILSTDLSTYLSTDLSIDISTDLSIDLSTDLSIDDVFESFVSNFYNSTGKQVTFFRYVNYATPKIIFYYIGSAGAQ